MLLSERIQGGLLGLLIGDALGVPYEFHEPENLPPLTEIEFKPPVHFRRAHVGTPIGTWSDDGAQALCLLASLLHCKGFDARNFANRLVNWFEHGYMAVDARVFDIGIQTAKAIRRLQDGAEPLSAGGSDEYSQGNGSLMRVLPLVLWHTGSDTQLIELAHLQSRVTHGHIVVQVCCALYCIWAKQILLDAKNPWETAVQILRTEYQTAPDFLAALENKILTQDAQPTRGTGYVVDCLFSSKLTLKAGSYADVVKASVALGHDTDTTACVAGGLAGLRDGVTAIPRRWQEALRGRELLEPLMKALLEHRKK